MMIGNAKCDVMRTQELVNVVVIPARRSVHEFDGASLQAFLTLTDLHQHPLAFCQPAQPAALKCRCWTKTSFPPPSGPTKPNPLSALYILTEPTLSVVAPTLGCRCEDERGAERPAGVPVT